MHLAFIRDNYANNIIMTLHIIEIECSYMQGNGSINLRILNDGPNQLLLSSVNSAWNVRTK
jgi:hypothetical protein